MTPEDLVEIELIKRLKYRYLRCLDQKLWDEIETCFVPEATARYGGGLYEFEGRDAIMEFLRDLHGGDHHAEQPPVPPSRDRPHRTGRATGTWALEDTVILTDFGINVQGAAFYTDRYVKEDGRLADRPHRLQAHLRGAHAPGVDRGPQAHRRLVGHRRAVDPGLSRLGAAPARVRPGWRRR